MVFSLAFSLVGIGMIDNLSYLIVGALFGASLDLAGFGNAKKLNDQFLLRDFSMFKVMFGAVFFAAAVSILLNKVFQLHAPPFLIPTLEVATLVGGFLLGTGLVIGGYCPGTALVAAASGKIDAVIFFLMIYPGYKFWTWLEPKLFYDLHTNLSNPNLTLYEAVGISQELALLGLAVLFVGGWIFGSRIEKK